MSHEQFAWQGPISSTSNLINLNQTFGEIVNEPITFTCPSGIITFPGTPTSEIFSATDADGTVIDASITNGGTVGISIIDLVPAAEVGGELTGTLDVADTVVGGTYDVEITFSNDDTPDAQTAACTVPVTVVPPTCPVVDSHQIGEVQGETDTSPVNGSSVTVSGIVVGDFQTTFSGFHIQDPDGDSNVLTSDGVFVYNTSHPVSVGDPVQITATVSEYNGSDKINFRLRFFDVWCPTNNCCPLKFPYLFPR